MTTNKTNPAQGHFHILFTVLATITATGGIIMGIWFLIFYHTNEETNDAQVDQYVTPIVTRITGYVKEVRYEENQFVHKDDTLVIIDNREYHAKLQIALAEATLAKKSVTVLENNVASTKSNIVVLHSKLAAAKAELWKAKQEYQRYTALLKEDAASEQQVESVQSEFESAKARYEEILHKIKSTQLDTEEAASKLPVATTFIGGKNAAVDYAALYLSYTVITAPYDGYLGKKTIQPGQLVKEGQTLAAIVSREKWITANFKETQVSQIKIGQTVTYKADAGSDEVFYGIVESFSPASGARFSILPPDNATGNFVKIEQRIPVRIKLIDEPDKTHFLRAGMNVTVTANHQN
jgi:membrane fusion protein (multidrug efflux system)